MYERLQNEATDLKIKVEERLMKKRIKGLYGDNVIWINKGIETSAEKACVLAEEIGHYHLSVGDILDQSITCNKKQEILARRWAFNKLVPLQSVVDVLKAGCRTRYEIAEMLQITEDFLEDTINYYRTKYGTQVRIDEKFILFFNPTLAFFENLEVESFEHKCQYHIS